MDVGERPQQNAFDDAEDGCIRADAQRQRQYSNSREAWSLSQGAQTESQIIGEIAKPVRICHAPHPLGFVRVGYPLDKTHGSAWRQQTRQRKNRAVVFYLDRGARHFEERSDEKSLFAPPF
jgi:hypothetical protein